MASLGEGPWPRLGLHPHCPPTPPPTAPAVHHHGSGPRHAALRPIHFFQEAEDTGRLSRDPVVWPAEVLVVPHYARWLLLGGAGW